MLGEQFVRRFSLKRRGKICDSIADRQFAFPAKGLNCWQNDLLGQIHQVAVVAASLAAFQQGEFRKALRVDALVSRSSMQHRRANCRVRVLGLATVTAAVIAGMTLSRIAPGCGSSS